MVDGLRLLDMLPTHAVVPAARAAAGDRGAPGRLEAVLREVAGTYDAVSDVLFAEAVHQTAAGNLDRAGAAAAALDRQERPVEPDVMRTPRDGAVVTNRVLVALRDGRRRRPAWPARGVRGAAEPRLDRWLGAVLGAPKPSPSGGRLVRGDGAHSDLDAGDRSRPRPVALGPRPDRRSGPRPTSRRSWSRGSPPCSPPR